MTSLVLEKGKKIMQYSLNFSGTRFLSSLNLKLLNFMVDSILLFMKFFRGRPLFFRE